MYGGYLKSVSRLALLASVGVIAGSVAASAADLGGNCCADLEERVAELEATTARKGNRRVSLQVYGQISQHVMFWDDGAERNTYVGENVFAKNRLGFRGSARINPEWQAGYKLEFEIFYSPSSDFNQLVNGEHGGVSGSAGTAAPWKLRHSALYLENSTFGTVWLGHSSTATSSITDINLAGSVNDEIAGVGNNDWFGSFRLRASGSVGDAGLSARSWDDVRARYGGSWNPGGLSRRTVVRYVSPSILGLTKSSGFNLQASWGEDDVWDAALRYVEDFGTFRIAAGIGYAWSGDADQQCARSALDPASRSASDCVFIGGSASIMHVPTGIYLTGAAGEVDDKRMDALYGRNVDNKHSFWYVQAGIEQKWFSLGKTTIYGDYAENSAGAQLTSGAIRTLGATDAINSLGATAHFVGSEIRQYGFGIVQDIDAAAMRLYLGYIHVEGDITLSNTTGGQVQKSRPIDDWQAVVMGATIRF